MQVWNPSFNASFLVDRFVTDKYLAGSALNCEVLRVKSVTVSVVKDSEVHALLYKDESIRQRS